MKHTMTCAHVIIVEIIGENHPGKPYFYSNSLKNIYKVILFIKQNKQLKFWCDSEIFYNKQQIHTSEFKET